MVIVAWRRDIWAMLGSNVQLESFGCVFIRNFLSSLYTILEMNKLFHDLGTLKVTEFLAVKQNVFVLISL